MIYHDEYRNVPEAAIEALLSQAELGRLVTVGAAGYPDLGLYPFTFHGDRVELHLNRDDAQLADLRVRPQCLFEVDDILGVIPSYWVHPDSAVMATAYHRTVMFECQAGLIDSAEVLSEQQMTLMARYQPEGGFKAVQPGDSLYAGALAMIRAVRLKIVERRVKFKLAQNRSPEMRRHLVAQLRGRGRHNDQRAADAIESTLATSPPRV